MTTFTIVMPVYQVAQFVAQAVSSVLAQTFTDFELLIIDDCGNDNSIAICNSFTDPRIKIITHDKNKGLAAARNTGIRHANGRYIAFLDADDMWHCEKLTYHFEHLEQNPRLGLSFCRSEFINELGDSANCYQMPRLTNIQPEHIFLRNPIGNGSAPVLRVQALIDIRYVDKKYSELTYSYFDEALRRSEDIDCWSRLALQTDWIIEGIPKPLTYYRLNAGGLSASLDKQYQSWQEVMSKIELQFPHFAAKYAKQARAYQLRYLSRQAIRLGLGKTALSFFYRALQEDKVIIKQEPGRTVATLMAALALNYTPRLFKKIESLSMGVWGKVQRLKIQKQIS